MRRLSVPSLFFIKITRCIADSNAFFELYGRNLDSSNNVGKTLKQSDPLSSLVRDKAIGEVFAQLYVDPAKDVSCAAVRKALVTLVLPLSLPRERRMRHNRCNWENALSIWTHVDQKDFQSVVSFLSVLYYSEKYTLLLLHAKNFISISQLHALHLEDICYMLRVSTIYILACSAAHLEPDECALRRIRQLLETSMLAMATKNKESASQLTAKKECIFLLYALDWYATGAKDSLRRELVSLLFMKFTPKRLRSQLFRLLDKIPSCATTPPASVLRVAAEFKREENYAKLWHLFVHCRRRESGSSGWRLFGLSVHLGNMLSTIPKPCPKMLSSVTAFCGSSLNFESLERIGSIASCRLDVLRILSAMDGARSYFAARQVLFHRPIREAAEFQEKYGDLLTGKSHITWRTALDSMNELLAKGNMQWREELPTVLRLLSDAGEVATLFRLLDESNTTGGAVASCMTAAAVAQAARRTSKWRRSLDVLDIIASSSPPQTETDELFLRDACLQAMYTLRDAKRWKEALMVYEQVAPVMPPTAHHVLCSVICNMPKAAPWETALTMAQKYGNVPEKFMATLFCARDPSKIDPERYRRFWRYMLQGYAEGGHWQMALRCIEGHEGIAAAWVSVLRAAQRATLGSLPDDYFSRLNPIVWHSAQLLRQCVLIAESHGKLCELYSVIQRYTAVHSSAMEYGALIRFLMGMNIPQDLDFGDAYIIHRLLMSPSKDSLEISVLWTRQSQELFKHHYKRNLRAFVQRCYKIHPTCAQRRCEEVQKTFTLTSVTPEACLKENILTISEHYIVAFKPVGAETPSYARAVTQFQKKEKGVYSLAYSLAPSSSGLIFLVESSLAKKAVHLVMKVLIRLRPGRLDALPLMSTEFFTEYKMKATAGPFPDGSVVLLALCLSDQNGLLAGSFYRLKENIVAEGWLFWESAEEDEEGESLYLMELTVGLYHPKSKVGAISESMHFSVTFPPSWALQ